MDNHFTKTRESIAEPVDMSFETIEHIIVHRETNKFCNVLQRLIEAGKNECMQEITELELAMKKSNAPLDFVLDCSKIIGSKPLMRPRRAKHVFYRILLICLSHPSQYNKTELVRSKAVEFVEATMRGMYIFGTKEIRALVFGYDLTTQDIDPEAIENFVKSLLRGKYRPHMVELDMINHFRLDKKLFVQEVTRIIYWAVMDNNPVVQPFDVARILQEYPVAQYIREHSLRSKISEIDIWRYVLQLLQKPQATGDAAITIIEGWGLNVDLFFSCYAETWSKESCTIQENQECEHLSQECIESQEDQEKEQEDQEKEQEDQSDNDNTTNEELDERNCNELVQEKEESLILLLKQSKIDAWKTLHSLKEASQMTKEEILQVISMFLDPPRQNHIIVPKGNRKKSKKAILTSQEEKDVEFDCNFKDLNVSADITPLNIMDVLKSSHPTSPFKAMTAARAIMSRDFTLEEVGHTRLQKFVKAMLQKPILFVHALDLIEKFQLRSLATQILPGLEHLSRTDHRRADYSVARLESMRLWKQPGLWRIALRCFQDNTQPPAVLQEWAPWQGYIASFHQTHVFPRLILPSTVNVHWVDDFSVVGALFRYRANQINDELIYFPVLQYAESVLKIPPNKLVGIDAEWKPPKNPVSVLQISTWTEIFLFDLPTLLQDASSETGQLFTTMFESLWSDETIIKIGFGIFSSDLPHLIQSYANILSRCLSTCSSVLDVQNLWQACRDSNRCTIESNEEKSSEITVSKNTSLKWLVEQVLGSALDKTEQCSDWSMRPLTQSQVEYAALDAWCLLPIATRLMEWGFWGEQLIDCDIVESNADKDSSASYAETQDELTKTWANEWWYSLLISTNAVESFELLELRVGIIRKVSMHPSAHKLYIIEVDLVESINESTAENDQTRQVVSGFVPYYSVEQLINRRVIVFCNVKPKSLRGVMSYGGIFCAASIDRSQLEIVDPPTESGVGEKIFLRNQSREPKYNGSLNQIDLSDPLNAWNVVRHAIYIDEYHTVCLDRFPIVAASGCCRVRSLQCGEFF